jgi:hypothetical protein
VSVVGEPWVLGAYWGSRPEDVTQCAGRLVRCLRQLGEVSPVLSTWFRKGSGKAAKVPLVLEPTVLSERLLAGRNRRDFGGEVIDELGYSLGLWNRNGTAPVGLSVTCGVYLQSPSVANSFVLNLPELDLESGEIVRDLYDHGAAVAAIRAVVDSWSPDWAVFSPYSLRSAQVSRPGEGYVGWATYSARLDPISVGRLPSEVAAIPAGNGTLVTLGGNPADSSESLAMAVREVIGDSLA